MNFKRTRNLLFRASTLLLICSCPMMHAFADTDPDPNSPTPILLTAPDSTVALATDGVQKLPQPKGRSYRFDLNSRVVLYVTNVILMPGEDSTAFRVYAEDVRGRLYRFPVLNLEPLDKQDRVFALTVELRDEIGYWEEPPAKGDVVISVAWRGLQSSVVQWTPWKNFEPWTKHRRQH